ncbi:LacI family transcriptional regulator [Luteolibacter arcticus]|uniref:LacI family transcriptional regulator n=1 Tax=Luteolibacter arcticus TaxID=1581411 RepID=A0ABT3GI06_9BACT|nr:LacI family DNA-binding transcriptional regulator [Luteolibacter arcticus]MCW1923149.1 LacI family transcriptional regulator [Luteolibacter arcticus]
MLVLAGLAAFYEYRFVSFDQSLTMRDLARDVGVSVSTVSKALRNDPSISVSRCLAIQAAAERLGYRPHPMVSALMAQMHHRRRRSDPHHIAWIDLWPAGKDGDPAMSAKPIMSGALARAQELGYGLEVYPVGTEGISPEGLRRRLAARGQWGMIIPPVPEPSMRFALDLRGFTGVTIGSSLHEPVMHRVSPNHFQGSVLAWTQLRAKGFERIGLALTPEMNERVETKWLAAFLACQQELPPRGRVNPLLASPDDPAGFARWLRREKPGVVLVAEKFPWCELPCSNGGQVSGLPIAWLMLQGGEQGVGGLDYQPEQLGRVAVEMVVAQIHRNERGSPDIPHTILINPVWTDC